MLSNDSKLRNVEFVACLREFERVVSKIPWNLVSPVEYNVKQRLNHVFSTYIRVHSMTDREVDNLMELIHTHRISNQVRNMIVARLLFELDKMNTTTSNALRNSIIQDRLIGVMR